MSVKSALSFIKCVEEDKDLQAKVMDQIKGGSKSTFEVAAEFGYHFNAEEYKEALKEHYGDRISEEQLNAIAAGGDCCCCCCPSCCCC